MSAIRSYDEIRLERDKLIPEVQNGSASARLRFFELEAELKQLIKEQKELYKSRKKTKP